jgi:hypothetical protein
MSPEDALARRRYFYMTGVNLIATMGAIFGLLVAGRSDALAGQLLGGAILLSGLYVMAVVPRAMARKWRTPPEA